MFVFVAGNGDVSDDIGAVAASRYGPRIANDRLYNLFSLQKKGNPATVLKQPAMRISFVFTAKRGQPATIKNRPAMVKRAICDTGKCFVFIAEWKPRINVNRGSTVKPKCCLLRETEWSN